MSSIHQGFEWKANVSALLGLCLVLVHLNQVSGQPPESTDRVTLQETTIGSNKTGNVDAKPAVSAQFLTDQIDKLSSENFVSRRLAQSRLAENIDQALPMLEQRLFASDVDVSLQIVAMLADASMDVESKTGVKAIEILDKIALEGATARALAARQSLDSVADYQNVKCQETLNSLDATLTSDNVPLNGREQPMMFLRIDDKFSGSAEDLRCLRWLKEIDLIWLDGKRIDGKWLEQVAKMKNLPALLIMRTSIKAEDLKYLSSLEKLKHLEIVYTPIGDQAVDVLGELPVWSSMRLFGTGISREGSERLREKLEDIDLLFGRGGFLGIVNSQDELVIQRVLPGGAAQVAGLQPGDMIIEIDKQPLKRFEELRKLLSTYAAGDEVELTYIRLQNQFGGMPMQRLPGQIPDAPKLEPQKVRVVLGEQ